MLVSELFELTWKKHWNKPQFKESRWAKNVESFYRVNVAPYFGDKDIKSLSPKMIRNWLNDLSEKRYAANRSLEVLSRMLTFAEEEELLPVGTNPCSVVKALPEVRRDRFATEEELKRVISVLEKKLTKMKSRAGAAFLLTILYTGSRPIAIARAKRADIKYFQINSETWGSITFVGKSTHTTGKKEQVLLCPKIIELLKLVHPPKDGSFFGVKKARTLWSIVCRDAGCEDLWSRDLRRTFATIGMSNGVGIDKIGELLNHNSAQTTKIYAKLMDGARVDAIQTITNSIERIKAGA